LEEDDAGSLADRHGQQKDAAGDALQRECMTHFRGMEIDRWDAAGRSNADRAEKSSSPLSACLLRCSGNFLIKHCLPRRERR
jgi:hypothetical protein